MEFEITGRDRKDNIRPVITSLKSDSHLSMIPDNRKQIRFRVDIVGIFFALFVTIIVARTVYLQIFRSSWLSKKAANQYEMSNKYSGKRGTIYDKNLKEMAVSTVVTSITANPQKIKNPKAAAKLLAKTLLVDRKVLVGKLTSDKKFVWIKRKVTPKNIEIVRNLKTIGVDFMPEYQRFYPHKTLAAQAIGFTGIDDQGLEGLEFYYNNYLSGPTSKFTLVRDALGRGFNAENMIVSGSAGENLVLTIDILVQYFAEKSLEEAVKKFSAKSGMAIVMVPETGAVLALAYYPLFNPNALDDFSQDLWRNRALTDPFEPGSTMKIFSAAAAIESGSSSPNSIFYCENGAFRIGKQVIHDTHKYGWLSLQQIIKYSSNIGTVKFSATTGPEFLYKTLRNFDFGSKTGIDSPGETSGRLTPYRRWAKIDAATIAFGQGISVSALQLISATSAVANKGILMKPYVTHAITDQNGQLVKSFGPTRIRRAISEKTARTLTRIMQTVIAEGGTGVNAALDGYSAGGKTGTAQKVGENGRYSDNKYVSSFVGFAPAKKSKIAVLVVIDEPQKQHYGGLVAAPVFRKIAQKTLDHIDTSPRSKTERTL